MKQKGVVLLPVLVVIVLVVIGVVGYFSYRNSQLSVTPNPTSGPSSKDISTGDWETYTNPKLGFSLMYPSELELLPAEANPKVEYREYVRKCESGEIDGCGGGRYPDFRVDFVNAQGEVIFSEVVYQLRVKDSGLAEIERDGYTYGTRFNEETIDSGYSFYEAAQIRHVPSTLSFVEPDRPLSCLWSPELGPGFDPVEDKEYIEDRKEDLSLLSGYYHQELSGQCTETTFYTWSNQVDTDAPPFKTLPECSAECLN